MKVFLSWAVVLLLGACGDGGEQQDRVTVFPGVSVVEQGRLEGPTHASYSLERAYRVGWTEGEPTFEWTISGAFLTDGRAAVGDLRAGRVRILDAQGAVADSFGRRGQGPGEFMQMVAIQPLADDTLLVQDVGSRRLTIFHEGRPVRELSVSAAALSRHHLIGATNDMAFFASAAHRVGFQEDWLKGSLLRLDLASQRIDTLSTYDWVLNADLRPSRFGPMGFVGAGHKGFVYGRSDRTEVLILSPDGKPDRVIRWEEDPNRLTELDWERYGEWFLMDPAMTLSRTERGERLGRMRPDLGSELPFFRRVWRDDAGGVWVGGYSTVARWTPYLLVFDHEGRWLGRVDLPPRFRVLDIAPGKVLGVEYDEYGVEAIALYTLAGEKDETG